MSKANGAGKRGRSGMRWMTRGRGTCWPAMVTPPLWPSLTFDSTWNVGRRFYIGKGCDPCVCGFKPGADRSLHIPNHIVILTCHHNSAAMRCSWRAECGGKDSASSSSRYCSSSLTGKIHCLHHDCVAVLDWNFYLCSGLSYSCHVLLSPISQEHLEGNSLPT